MSGKGPSRGSEKIYGITWKHTLLIILFIFNIFCLIIVIIIYIIVLLFLLVYILLLTLLLLLKLILSSFLPLLFSINIY